MTDSDGGGASINIGVRSTPFAGEPDGAAEYYEAMGRVMCLWGRFESALTHDLLLMRWWPETEGVFKPFPKEFGKKIKAFRKCCTRSEVLHQFLPQIDIFAAHARKVAGERHIVAHGSFRNFVSREPLEAQFRMLHVVEGIPEERAHLCTLDEMLELAAKVDDLNTSFVFLAMAVFNIYQNQETARSGPNGLLRQPDN